MPTQPVFLSRPTALDQTSSKEADRFERFLNGHGFHPVRLGGGSYSTKAPLQAVIDLMKTCNGAIILGYPKQTICISGFSADFRIELSTPWNQIEGALAYALQKPTLVVSHTGVKGGVFDYGITGEFVLRANLESEGWFQTPEFTGVFNDWKAKI
jgi:hypothetical protein